MRTGLTRRRRAMLCLALLVSGAGMAYAADGEQPAPDGGASAKMKAGGAAVKHDAKAVGAAAKAGAEKIKIESKHISHEVADAAKKGAHEVKVIAKHIADETKKIVGHGTANHPDEPR